MSSSISISILSAESSTNAAESRPPISDTSAAGSDEKGRRKKIVVIGSANYDLTSYTARLPELGETILGQRFETSAGGKGANQAVAAARLGIAESVTMVCRVGPDVFGQALLDNFASAGVVVNAKDSVVLDGDNAEAPVSSGVAAITVETTSGDNCIIVTPGANERLTPAEVESSLASLRDDPPHIAMVQLEIPYDSALHALKACKQMGALTILNPAPAPKNMDALREFYEYVDILIPNESELRQLVGTSDDSTESSDEAAMAKLLLDRGVGKAVVVTLGARGAMVVARRQSDQDSDDMDAEPTVALVKAPDDLPCRDDPVVDTIGAGDAFCGALASYLSANVNLVEAAERACGVAGISVRRRGASYPTVVDLPSSLRLPCHDVKQQDSLSSSASKPRITFVTGNPNKLKEVQQILSRDEADLPFEIVNEALDLPELQGKDPADIARHKCALAAEQVKGPCFTEDTSLCFNALNGMPGPYIKWFLDSCGHEGLNAMLEGFDDKSAVAQTIVAYTDGPNQHVHVFEGKTDGTIVQPRGSLEFGWDPIFQPFELGGHRTYAEMNKDEKNSISHRGRSFAKLREFLLRRSAN
jgi:ribokinase/non-canonical purine NTP pyrophosphatase (RdgB/HAM1 family)